MVGQIWAQSVKMSGSQRLSETPTLVMIIDINLNKWEKWLFINKVLTPCATCVNYLLGCLRHMVKLATATTTIIIYRTFEVYQPPNPPVIHQNAGLFFLRKAIVIHSLEHAQWTFWPHYWWIINRPKLWRFELNS